MSGWTVGRIGMTGNLGPFSDNFNRPDSTTTINPASDGNNWIVYERVWGINTNTGCTIATTGAIAPFLSNPNGPGSFISGGYIGSETGATGAQTVTVDIKATSSTPTMGVYLNFNPSVGSAYFLIMGNTSATLYRAGDFTAGSLSTLGTVTLTAWQGTGNVMGNGITTIRVSHDGAGTLKVYQDVGSGLTLKATITDPGTVLAGSQVLLETNVAAAGSTKSNFDNFTVTTP